MPEGAECAILATQLNDILVGNTIVSADILEGKYAKKSPKDWEKFLDLLPQRIVKVKNKGKRIFFFLDGTKGKTWLMCGLGMTGKWKLDASTKNDKFKFTLKDTNPVYYNDSRGFGSIDVFVTESDYESARKKLAPPFIGMDKINKQQFIDRVGVQCKTSNLCTVFMNQNKVCSGVGMYVIVECLYKCKLSPLTTVGSLSHKQVLKLYKNFKRIFKNSYKHGGNSEQSHVDMYGKKGNYGDYLLIYGKKEDINGNAVEKVKINGRDVSWVPNIQSVIM